MASSTCQRIAARPAAIAAVGRASTFLLRERQAAADSFVGTMRCVMVYYRLSGRQMQLLARACVMSGLFAGTKWERPATCEQCAKPRTECTCPRNAAGELCLPKDQPVRVSRERRGGGKMVTIVSGLDAKATDLGGLLKRFRGEFGTGGTIADGRIELQGDHREKVVAELIELGYPAKASGG